MQTSQTPKRCAGRCDWASSSVYEKEVDRYGFSKHEWLVAPKMPWLLYICCFIGWKELLEPNCQNNEEPINLYIGRTMLRPLPCIQAGVRTQIMTVHMSSTLWLAERCLIRTTSSCSLFYCQFHSGVWIKLVPWFNFEREVQHYQELPKSPRFSRVTSAEEKRCGQDWGSNPGFQIAGLSH